MKIDAALPPVFLTDVPKYASAVESLGFSALWTSETKHDPFLPCALIAEHTQRLSIGTAVAISFARSPANLAYTAWDLAQASQGRFILGLGTQVRAHIQRRFGMDWPDSVIGKFREQIEAIRAFWNSWQTNSRLNYRGTYYKLTLMSPFFDPGPIKFPDIPIYIAGVNTGLARLAGETADGFHVHPFHSARYLREVLLPAIEQGAEKSGRTLQDVSLAVTAFTCTNDVECNFVRQQIAFYASTPSYRRVLRLHGWDDVGDTLSGLASRGKWEEMPKLIDDDMLNAFAVVADADALADRLAERYHGLADRLTLYSPFVPGERDEFWKQLISRLQEV